jgi:hypothetical protein
MAVVPGATSGTYNFAPSNSSLILEAFDRCRIRPTELITRHHMPSARMSLNLEMLDWSDSGINLWKVISGTINLVTGTATYVLDQSIETLTEVYYSQINGDGAGQNNDRIMVPVTRTQYAMIPNKLTQGTPTQYWLQMLAVPQVTFWQVPQQGAPNYVVSWYGLQRMQDANVGGGEAPDIVYRAYEALIGRLALRLWTKFGWEVSKNDAGAFKTHRDILKEEAENGWNNFQTRDQETGPMMIQPAVGVYGRM